MPSNSADILVNKLHVAIDYCRQECDMCYAEVIGALEIVKHDMVQEAKETEDDNNSDDQD